MELLGMLDGRMILSEQPERRLTQCKLQGMTPRLPDWRCHVSEEKRTCGNCRWHQRGDCMVPLPISIDYTTGQYMERETAADDCECWKEM
jgi:hypothetical protein